MIAGQVESPCCLIRGGLLTNMAEQRCPYPGLVYFDADYADLFFGREHELQRLNELLKHQTFVAVIGHQEVGKSSLVRAGLKKKPVQIQEKNDSEDREYLVFRPGDRPWESLAFAIAAEVEAEHIEQLSLGQRLGRDLRSDITLNQAITTFFPQHKLPKLIIIDQFEEIFFLVDSRNRDDFVKQIVDAVADHNETVRIVITLRSDAIQHCFQYPQLRRLLLELAHVFLDDLSGTSLHDVIVQPCRSVGLNFEEGLVQQIQEEAQDGGASISSVQMLLYELWNRRPNDQMTWEAYRNLGGVKNIITRMADEFFSRLRDQEKQLCLNILSRLTTFQNGTVIERRASRGECYPTGIAATTVDSSIMQLKASQLVKESENGYLEITSQAVLHWEHLNEWLKKNRAWLEFHQRLREFAKAWEDSSQDPLLLYRGTLLQELKSWAQQQPAMLNELEQRFIDVSLAQHGERRGKKGIFVNYRRFDTIQISHRLADSLYKIF